MKRFDGVSMTRWVVLFALTCGLWGLSPDALAQDDPEQGESNQGQNQNQEQDQDQDQDQALSLWQDFSHYVYVARPQLAAASAQKLLDMGQSGALLEAVESARYEPEKVFQRAQGMDNVKSVAGQLNQAVEQARLDRSRNEQRIAQNIGLLNQGQRPYTNAVGRLHEAGQFAAPQLLEALKDQNKSQLHPFLINAMSDIGQSLAYPLAVALPDLSPVTQGQVAQILARIGYPTPVPYLKQVLENDQTDPSAREAIQTAYDQLIQRTDYPPNLSSAELFERFGRRYYRAGTDGRKVTGVDEQTGKGIVWAYSQETGLVKIPVPTEVYASVRAKRSAKRALRRDSSLDSALSLFLASDLRRENRLPDGVKDPSDQEDKPASYFTMLAGPMRQHDVLSTAMDDKDPALALDAISALSKTAATDALTTTRQSLIRALSYPDRRVRFHAAQALAAAHPTSDFPKSFRVVPVLADEVRQSDTRYALVLGDDQETVNKLLSAMNELGFEAFGGTSMGQLTGQIERRPGIDIIVVARQAGAVRRLISQTGGNLKLQNAPVLALVSEGDKIRLQNALSGSQRINPVVRTTETEQLNSAVDQTIADYAGQPINSQEAGNFSMQALSLLRDLALRQSDIYNVLDAQQALEQALSDDRDEVVTKAGQVLALIDNQSAQRAIAGAALNNSEDQVQIALLRSLADSATQYGNKLSQQQRDTLLDLVKSSQGQTAIAAAQAHGALTLPTSNAVELIVASQQ